MRIKLYSTCRIGMHLHNASSLSSTNNSKILLYKKGDYEADMLKFNFSKVPHRIFARISFINLIYFKLLGNSIE